MKTHRYDEKTVARFWAKVNKNGPVPAHRPELGPCWVWTASVTKSGGYGQMFTGYVGGVRQVTRAHRLAYELAGNQIPNGFVVMHKCDNPKCCNPTHLECGTHAANVHDCIAKGRKAPPPYFPDINRGKPLVRAKGAAHGGAKLTEAQVIEIRASTGSVLINEMADKYGVTPENISSILRRKTWKHIP